jgi:hypothetical protein
MARPYSGTPLAPDMAARLFVKRDCMDDRQWRLAWSRPESDSYCYDTGECDSAGRFRTMREAIAYGKRHYGETARRAPQWGAF